MKVRVVEKMAGQVYMESGEIMHANK